MKRYADILKRLAEIEKQANPTRMVTVTMPDGTEKKMKPLEFWPQREKFIFQDERGVTHYLARVEGLSPELFSILLIEGETADRENADDMRGLFTFLTIFFGRSTAIRIMDSEGDETDE